VCKSREVIFNIMKAAKYKHKLKTTLAVFLMFVMAGSLSTSFVAAQENEDTQTGNYNTVSFTVRLNIEGEARTQDEVFYFDLARSEGDDDAPLPETDASFFASDDGKETAASDNSRFIIIKGEDTASFGPIVFNTAGEYHYTITMRDENIPDGYTHDDTVYDVTVRTSYNKKGELVAGYYATARTGAQTITEDDTDEIQEDGKKGELSFLIYYGKIVAGSSDDPNGHDDPSMSDDTDESDDSDESENPDGSEGSGNQGTLPKTGDDTDNLPWIVLLCAVGLGSVCCVRYLKVSAKHSGRGAKK
jgi:pilin isopeptide linkage protein